MVGENFHFGFRAAGDVATLTALGAGDAATNPARRFAVSGVPLLTDGSQPSSSTLIRQAVADGDLGRVRELSDHGFRFCGVVVKGDQRGREMGYPTANVAVPLGLAVPADGVYAGWVTRLDVPDAERWPAAISVAPTRPSTAWSANVASSPTSLTVTTSSSTGSRSPWTSTRGCAVR